MTLLVDRRLYVDMDGVLADFDRGHREAYGYSRTRHTGWSHIKPGFFRGLQPMPDMEHLWRAISHLGPIVLTGVPTSVNAASNDKIDWIRQHVGPDVGVICCQARRKWVYCRPGDILIDDSEEYRPLWEEAGGIWVQHECAAQTIKRLREIGILGERHGMAVETEKLPVAYQTA